MQTHSCTPTQFRHNIHVRARSLINEVAKSHCIIQRITIYNNKFITALLVRIINFLLQPPTATSLLAFCFL